MMLLVDSTVRTSALLLVALAARRLLRRRSAAVRHYVLSTALVTAAALPLLGSIVPSWHVPSFPTVVRRATASPEVVVSMDAAEADDVATAERPVQRQPTSAPIRLSTIIAVTWAAGAGVSLAVLIAGFVRLRSIALRARPVRDGAWHDLLTETAARTGIRRPVRLLESDHPSLLVTWGSRAPTIVVPRAAVTWPADRIRVVLRHEFAHIVRGDWLMQVVAEFVRAAYWFNPIVWLACARVRQESERACDDAVLAAGVGAAEYASHLVDVARAMRPGGPAWLPAHGIAKRSTLEERVSAMLNAHVNRAPMSLSGRFAAATAVLGAAIAVAAFAPPTGTVLSGKVVDAMGRPLVGQAVKLTDTQSHASRETTTDATGAFTFAPQPAGDYVIEAERLGFERFVQPIKLAGTTIQQTITMRLGTIEERVRVIDAPPPPPPAPPAPPAPPVGKIGPPPPVPAVPPTPAAPAAPNWVELREKVRAKRANNPCATSDEGGCIQAPIKIRDAKPLYPESLKGSGIGGVVTLKGTVAADGAVHGLDVVSSPHADLSSAAIAAVGQWLFEPTTLDGTTVETPITIHVTFAPSR